MNSNNPLAVKLETENDAAFKNSPVTRLIFPFRLKLRFKRQPRGFPKMINTLKHRGPLVIAIFMVVAPVLAQAPTDAQRSAIRSECRADYEAHCASVPPGGAASLQCLQKNMSSLSSGCQAAVRAIEPAEPKAESAPAAAPKAEATPPKAEIAPAKPATETAATPKAAATSTAAKQPSGAQVSAIQSACRKDYPKVCAGVPTGGAPALQCLEKNKSKVSAACAKAVTAGSGGASPATAGAPAAASPAAAPAAAAPTVLVLRPLRPREELFVLRSACGGDVRLLCGGVAPGGGRIVQCLAARAASLSPACKDVLAQFAAQ
jgi:hypothetical protein